MVWPVSPLFEGEAASRVEGSEKAGEAVGEANQFGDSETPTWDGIQVPEYAGVPGVRVE